MNARRTDPSPGEQGFSLIELVAVVGIIGVMAGVARPSIATYIRNYKINGAQREVSSELSAARSRAISKNTQSGVSFVVVDANSYRFIVEDPTLGTTTVGPLHDLPVGVIFTPPVGGAAVGFAVRFNRLGAACPAWVVPTCVLGPGGDPVAPAAASPPLSYCLPEDAARCVDGPSPGVNYLDVDADGRTVRVGLAETNTGLRKLIRIAPGGRVQVLPQ
jgi:prepilin-type N-terminal cleavage/methylation domain-containing protein